MGLFPMCLPIYTHTHTHYVYTHKFEERERERKKNKEKEGVRERELGELNLKLGKPLIELGEAWKVGEKVKSYETLYVYVCICVYIDVRDSM